MNLRSILIGLGIVTAIALMLQPQNVSALVVFLFLGIIPGTDITIPSWIMMPVFLLFSLLLVQWIIKQPTQAAVSTHAKRTTTSVTRRTAPRSLQTKRQPNRRSQRLARRYPKPVEVQP